MKLISLAVASCFAGEGAYANPTGATVVHGTASINQQGNLLQITNSPSSIIHWQSFSIGASEITRFLQQSASSAVLNRVITQNPSSILGALQSNGRVFLINPNGILFGAGAQIDVAGLIASTLNLSDADFLAGRLRFTEVPGAGSVINQGAINTAQGGQVYLVGPAVTNSGIITSPKGEVILAAGNAVELVEPGTPNLRVEITAPDNQAVNLGQIIADAGRIGIYAGLINHSGTIRANSAFVTEDGRIVLKATKNVTLEAGSITTASGPKGGSITAQADGGMLLASGTIEAEGSSGQGGAVVLAAPVLIQTGNARADGASGGSVSVQAGNYLQSAALSADGTQGAGGSVTVQADRIIQTASATLSANGNGGAGGTVNVAAGQEEGGRIFSSASFSATGDIGGAITVTGRDIVLRAATLDASGDNAGGTVLAGGDWQGGNPAVPNSRSTHVNFSTALRADARKRGDGGNVVVWSDDDTRFFGTVSARGGAEGGDGGRIEVSGRENLVFGGLADAGAPNGRAGVLLLDPKNITIDVSGGPLATDLVDPNIGADDRFGEGAVVLTNGNIVAPDSNDSFVATNAGAVYLFNGSTGALSSTLTGTSVGDQVGSDGVTALTNGNYVVSSPSWTNGKGAVTWGSGTTGVTGAVSAANSLVGTRVFGPVGEGSDQVGMGGVTALTNGNYVVSSPSWNNGAITGAGAVTWGSGTLGVVGAVSALNSLLGTHASDQVGSDGVTALTNGNYVVSSPSWTNGKGAVTWGSGTTGVTGAVSAANSLVGTRVFDPVGEGGDQVGIGGVDALTNGNFVVRSFLWNKGAGAATWGNGATGVTGAVSSANSLVGATTSDQVSSGGVAALTNGNAIVLSPMWGNGTALAAGAATWINGANGQLVNGSTAGAVSAANSLTGTNANDQVGSRSVAALTNGNAIVLSPMWRNGTALAAGAATWINGANGRLVTGLTAGPVSAANSLVGTAAGDLVGIGNAAALTNGNYVVSSPSWNNGAGAVTWGNGTTGVTGAVSSANSLVGATTGDQVGIRGVAALTNGNYVVSSPSWNNIGAAGAGAVTWGNGTTGVTGTVSSANSLVGTSAFDQVGSEGVTALTNGNYVVISPNWNNGATIGAGAVTWGNGATGVTGTVSSANSLVGTTANDQVGMGGVIALTNGNYVVSSYFWNKGAAASAGAATWGSGTTGVTGAVSSANSLTGTNADDQVGSGGITEISGNRVLVSSPFYDNGAVDSGRLQIYDGSGAGSFTNPLAFTDNPSGNVTITPSAITAITNTGTAVTLQASNDVALNAAITSNNPSGNGGALTLQAGRSILINSNVTTDNGNFTLVANETAGNGVVNAQRDPGSAVITMAPGTAIDTGTGNLSITLGNGAGLTNSTSGAITLQALTGNAISITNSGSTPGSGVTFNGPVSALGALTASTANSGITVNAGLSTAGAVVLDAGSSGTIAFSGSLLAGSLSATAGGGIADSAGATLAVTGNASFSGGNIVLGDTALDVTNFGSLTFNSTGAVNITEDSSIALTGTNTASSLTLTSAGAISDAAGTSLTVTSNASFTGTSIILADNATDILSVGGNASFNAASGGITLGAAGTVNFGSLTFNSTDAVNITEDSAMVLVGSNTASSVTLTATGGSITQTAGTVTATALELSAATGISLPTLAVTNVQATNSTSGDVALADAGGLSITNISNIGGTISVATTGDLTVNGNVTSGAHATSLTATGGVISQTGGTVTAGALSLSASNGISLTAASIDTLQATNTSGAVSVTDTTGVLNIVGAGVTSGGNVTLSTPGNLTLTSGVTATGATATLTSTTGTVVQAGGAVNAASLVLDTATGATLGNLNVSNLTATNTTSGDMDLTTTGSVVVVGTGIVNTPGNITLRPGGNLTVSGDVNAGANTVTLDVAGGSIGQAAGAVTAGTALLTADTGISLTAGSIATLEATNNTSGNISITGMSGPLTVGAGGVTNSATAGSVTLATTGALNLAGNATVQSGQMISLSGGTISSTGGAPIAGTLLLSSVNGTALSNVMATNLSATNTGAGSIDLDVTGDVTIVGPGLVNTGGNAVLTAPGNLTIGANVNVSGTAALTAGGSITQTAGMITADIVTLAATSGSIGTSTSARVNTQAGNLVANAGNGGVFISELDSVNLGASSAGGSFDLVSGGPLTVSGDVTGAGPVSLAAIGFTNNATISAAGELNIDANGGAFVNSAGAVISGSGTLDATGTVFTNHGTLRPGGSNAAGSLNIIGDAAFSATSVVEIEAGGTVAGRYDTVAVSGNAGLGGVLTVSNIEGYVPANGASLVPVTFASASGSFTVTPAGTYTATYNPTNLTLAFGIVDAINRWIGTSGNWAVLSNWSLGHVPTDTETVLIDVPGLQTITVSGGNQAAFMLTSEENFTITSGSLDLGGPSTFNGAFTLSGGRLQGAGDVVVNGDFYWTGGELSGPGTFTTVGTSTLSPRFHDLELRRDWINLGTINWLGQHGRDLYIRDDGTLINAPGGTLNLLAGRRSDIRGYGELINEGTVNKSGYNTNSIETWFSNLGTLNVNQGTLGLKRSTGNDGTINIGSHATLDLSGYRYTNRGLISGTGTLDVRGLKFTNDGVVAPGVAGGTGIGKLTIEGDYRQGAHGVLLMDVAGKKSGQYDVLDVNGKAYLDGTLAVNAVGRYVPRKGDRFGLITYKSRFGAFDTLDGPAGFDLKVDYDWKSATFKLVPD